MRKIIEKIEKISVENIQKRSYVWENNRMHKSSKK